MLRPGGFIEYSPKEQKVFDMIHRTIEQTFAQYGYQHIHTPAVESVDVLKKGGDEVSKQIFGLNSLKELESFCMSPYLLNQIIDDNKDDLQEAKTIIRGHFLPGDGITKSYALHFDLTVPFARYVLDRQNELAFPFKRYQIQPVWRGERSQKGRYKEFRQADIDVIWKTKDDKGYNAIYDADCMITLATTLSNILDKVGLSDKKISIHFNNKQYLYWLFENNNVAKDKYSAILGVLDKYYKLSSDEFYEQIREFAPESLIRIIIALKSNIPDYRSITDIDVACRERFAKIKNVEIQYDPFIVRGLDYYTGTVFETFIDDRKELGSICSGGAYANLTEFLDPKQSFSGVGGSIGLSRLMSVLVEDYKIMETFVPQEESYLIIHEEKTAEQAQDIVAQLRTQHKIVELYPLPDKLDKQFRYAEKKGISHIIQIFDGVAKVKKVGDTQRSVL